MTEPGPERAARPRFSVITVNYNGLGWTKAAVLSVLGQQGPSVEVLVVDNASKDGSLEELRLLERPGPTPVRLLPQDSNLGFAAACNRGYQASRGDLILLLNNDARLEPGALAAAEAAVARHPEAGSFALSMRFLDEPSTLNSTGLWAFWDGSTVDRDFGKPVSQGPVSEGPVVGPMGGAALWKREVLEKVGFLEEEFFMYAEDTDQALRAQRAGFACIHVPDAVVLHKGSVSVNREPRKWALELLHRNSMRVLARNFGTPARWRALMVFAARVVTGTLRNGGMDGAARLKALGFGFRHRKELREQRRAIRALGPDARVSVWLHLRAPPR